MHGRWQKVLRKALTVVVAVTAVGVLAVGLSFVAVWLDHNASLELPRTTGPYAVGRIGVTWVDTVRSDPFAPAPTRPRELVVWIWYPAERSDRAQPAEYIPGPWRRALAARSSSLLAKVIWRDLAKVHGHSVENADVAQAGAPFPVVLFGSGIGALAFQYTTLVEDLASHGYIVVGADRPYSTSVVVMPDGRIIYKTEQANPGDAPISEAERVRRAQSLIWVWTADARFLLDQVARLNEHDPSGRFTGKIKLDAVGIAGHSFGGATAAQLCHDDGRCRAGIDIDGMLFGSVVKDGIGQPFLFLLSDHGDVWQSPDCQICADIRSAAKRAPADKLIVTLLGAHHFSFSDQLLTFNHFLRPVFVMLTGQGRLDPRTGLASACRYVREFFDVHLRGARRDALYSGPLVPGVRIERKE